MVQPPPHKFPITEIVACLVSHVNSYRTLGFLAALGLLHNPRYTMDRLNGKRALITGGTTGIGLETAKLFLHEGARVMITGTNPATLEAARKELGSEAAVVASDAGDIAAQQTLAKTVVQKFDRLDILVVNAGIVDMRPLEKWDEAGF